MKKMLVLILSLMIASSAMAVVDTDNDMLGIYFDMAADSNCLTGLAPYAQAPAYVIMTNPTNDLIGGFEFGYDIVGNALVLETVFTSPQALDVGGPGNHIVGLGSPMATSEATVLATLTVLNTDTAGAPVFFALHGSNPSSIDPALPTVLYGQGQLMTLGTSTLPGTYNAVINGECGDVVDTDATSLDSFKSLYR